MSSPQFSSGHVDWGVLIWPLERYSSDDEIEYYMNWKAVEMEPVWQSNMICLQCNRSSWENLLDAMLSHIEGPNVSGQPIYSFNLLHKCIIRSFLFF